MTARSTVFRALLRWLRRYLPAELVAAPCALGAGLAAADVTGSVAAAALAATWGENAGFYGLMIGRELRQRRSLRALPGAVRALALAPHPALGLLAGKLLADVTFYAPAIACHELQRAWARDGRRTLLPVAGALVSLSLAAASLA